MTMSDDWTETDDWTKSGSSEKEIAERTHYRHEHGQPCPLTGAVPVVEIFSDHDRPGVFNSCIHCNAEGNVGLADRLRRLNAERGRRA